MKQNIIPALLAVIAVLLGLNLVSKESPAAVGQVAAGMQEPVPVAMSVTQIIGNNGSGSHHWRVFRLWSDGAVDTTLVEYVAPGVANCDINSTCYRQVLSGSCQSDINRNSEVEVTDFLQLIGEWGPCQ